MKKIFTLFVTFAFVLTTSHFVLATDYDVELVVPDGKKSKQTDAVLRINETDFHFIIEKEKFKDTKSDSHLKI